MKRNEFRIGILKQEIELIHQKMNHFDCMRLKTKQMAIFLWVAVVGFGLKTDSPTDNGSVFLLAALVPFPFWHLEASFRRYYAGWSLRFKAIMKFLYNEEYPIKGDTIVTLKGFLNEDEEERNFPVSDFWAKNTVKENVFKDATKLRRSYFDHKIIWVYFPMVLISLSYALKKLLEDNLNKAGIPAVPLIAVIAVALIAVMLIFSFRYNKKKK